MWLNPRNPNTCPAELLKTFARDAATEDLYDNLDNAELDISSEALDNDEEPAPRRPNERNRGLDNASHATRLKEEMRRDALQSGAGFDDIAQDSGSYRGGTGRLSGHEDASVDKEVDTLEFSPEQVAEAREFLGLQVRGYRFTR